MSCDGKLSEKDISERTLVKVREYSQFYCDLVAEHYTIIVKYSPSKVAVACFYLARKSCQIKSTWTTDLEQYTGYSE